jgi:Tfp pilus assembly protein PilF
MTYLRAGDLERARADIEQAIQEEPQTATGYYVRANIKDQQGDCMAAIADLEHASELAQLTGNVQLDAIVRAQLAYVTQACAARMPTPIPLP